MSEQVIQARVERITPLTNTILQLILDPETYVDYQAGQYLQILTPKEAFSYSIANAPLGSHKYELHIRHSQENPYNEPLLADIKRHGTVQLRLPLGHCHLNHLNHEKPILFIAGGTGFAPIKAMIEQLLADGETRPFELYWGARSQSDLYMDTLVLQWEKHVPHFQYRSLIASQRHQSLDTLVLKRHGATIKDWQVVIAGAFEMAHHVRDQLMAHGVARNDLFSDAFDFP